MDMNTVLQLRFGTETEGRIATINIQNPRADLMDNEVSQAMDDIIENGSIITSNGKLVEKHSAVVVVTQRQEYDVE